MARVREFYVPTGAASNFLAGKCLWAEDDGSAITNTHHEERENEINEYFIQRSRIKITEHIQRTKDNGYIIPTAYHHDINIHNEWTGRPLDTEKYLVKETDNILLTLKQLDAEIDLLETTQPDEWFSKPSSKLRKDIINGDIYSFWKETSTHQYQAFLSQFGELGNSNPDIYQNKLITKVQEYFTVCREFYFKYCIDKGWNSDIITHVHPKRLMPNIKFPDKGKTLAMNIGNLIFYCTALSMIKSDTLDRERLMKYNNSVHEDDNVKFSDDAVDYRKIFFKNDRDEIRKMYEFFGNEEYFDNNETVILSQFKQYNDKNVDLIIAHDLGVLIDG
jgi:hypothetical protein